ncbi:MAG: hypothetical protein LBM05_00305 [Endomicrobium sp.]|nr:hypothetical protein [Endomicrobium sp.]
MAHILNLSDTMQIIEKSIKGFAIDVEGKTSHTIILAQGGLVFQL